MLLSVRTLDGKAIPVEVHLNETVLAVKKRIQQKETIRVDLQRLVLNNVQLNNHQKLSECAVDEESILYLVLRNYPSFVFFFDDRTVHLGSPETSHILAGGFGPGSGTHQLRFPYSFVIESDQNAVTIADWGNHRIVRWAMNELEGEVLIPAQGRPNPLNGPTDVILDKEGDSLIICDRGHRRILRWSRRSEASEVEVLLGNIAGWGLALDGERNLYISDTDSHAVRRYRLDTMGEGVIVAGGHGQGAGFHQLNQPTYLFVDRHGNVYVTDTGNHRVMKWNREATVGLIVAQGFPRGL